MPDDKKKKTAEDATPFPEKQTGDPGSWGKEELQARADKIEALGYVPLDVNIDEIELPDPQASRDETTPADEQPAPGGKSTKADAKVRDEE